jgi:hypothetical protein
MKNQVIFTRAQSFESNGRTLVSWAVGGHSINDKDPAHDWQCETVTIATVSEAEAFAAKLSAAIAEAKEAQDRLDEAKGATAEPAQATEDATT